MRTFNKKRINIDVFKILFNRNKRKHENFFQENEIVAKMEEAYDKTEKSGNEHGFVVGRKGGSSKIVEGDEGKISSKDWAAALDEIVGQDDLKSYDVHTHPNTSESDGNVGTPNPSVVFRFLCQVYFFDLKTDHQMSKRAEVYGGVAGL